MALPIVPVIAGVGGALAGLFVGKKDPAIAGDKSPQGITGGFLEIATKKDTYAQYTSTQDTFAPTSIYSPTTSTTKTYAPQYTMSYIIDSPYATATQTPTLQPLITTTQTPQITAQPYIVPMQDISQSPKTATESTFGAIIPYILIGGGVYFLFFKTGGRKKWLKQF